MTISKIRFLESQGLVNPERTPSGYRKFYEHDVERLRWVLRQQREHFLPLKVIKDRLDEDGNGSEDTGAVRSGASSRRATTRPAPAASAPDQAGAGTQSGTTEPVLVGQGAVAAPAAGTHSAGHLGGSRPPAPAGSTPATTAAPEGIEVDGADACRHHSAGTTGTPAVRHRRPRPRHRPRPWARRPRRDRSNMPTGPAWPLNRRPTPPTASPATVPATGPVVARPRRPPPRAPPLARRRGPAPAGSRSRRQRRTGRRRRHRRPS